MVVTKQMQEAVGDEPSKPVMQGLFVFIGLTACGVDRDDDIAQLLNRHQGKRTVCPVGKGEGQNIGRPALVPVMVVEPAYFLIIDQQDAQAIAGNPAFSQERSSPALQEPAVDAAVRAVGMKREINEHSGGWGMDCGDELRRFFYDLADCRSWLTGHNTILLLFFIGSDDLLNQGMTHHIGLGKGAEGNPFQRLKKLSGLKKS